MDGTLHNMSRFVFRGLFLGIVCVHLTLSTESPDSDTHGKQNVLLHEAVRTLLGFKEEPTSSPIGNLLEEEAPKYMLELYERFKNSPIYKGQLTGNTVRSIHAETADINGEAMFVFNLTSIFPTEKILSAEIHFFKRKAKPWSKKGDVELLMYEIAPHYLSENGKITMRAETFGWQWYDVTNAVESCLAARRNEPHLFAMNFQTEKANGKNKSIVLKKFIHHHSVPFLIVYSNDTKIVKLDNLDLLAEKLRQKEIPPEVKIKKTETEVKESVGIPESVAMDTSNPATDDHRQKRSIFTNEIPEDPADFDKHFKFNIPQTHPGILQARKDSRRKISNSRLIPYPDVSDKRKRRKKHGKNRKRNGRKNNNKKIPRFPEEWDDYKDNRDIMDKHGSLCGRRKLVVDFRDIGWGDWIISPKSFEAQFCSGSCPFPLTKRLRPSNHATIQSIVHAIGIYRNVPAPCCVPDSLSSVTLLYFDESRNVVLKNYPDMSVQSCACR